MRSTVHTRARRAFTLIEILIVVVILGILAAIVIPQFSNASTEASEASLRSQLQTIRSQLELYRVQNGDTYPDLVANGWTDLTNDPAGRDYLQAAPRNPLMGAGVQTGVGAPGSGEAWWWDGDVLQANDGNDVAFDEDNDGNPG